MKIINLKKILILFLTGVFIGTLVQDVYTKERKGYHPPPTLAPVSNNWMQVNNINTIFRSDGYFNYDKITFPGGEAGMVWPVSEASRKTIDFTTGIFVGGKVNGEIRLAASLYNTHYSPGNIPVIGQVPATSVCSDPRFKMYQVSLTDPALINGGTRLKVAGGRTYTITYDPWSAWPVDLGAAYVEVNGIAGYQPDFNGDRPGIGNSTTRPDEVLWCTFMDYTNCTNSIHYSELSLPGGSVPIGVEIQQTSFAYLSPGLVDMYFVKWKIINRSSNTWDSTYIGVVNDADIGGDAFDDATGCDSAKSVGFIYNFDNNDPQYGDNPPAVGFKYLQGPVVFTGDPNDTAKLPYITLVGYKQLGMSGFNTFANGGNECTGDPDEHFRAYYFLRGQNGCGVPLYNFALNYPTKYVFNGSLCPPSGWYDTTFPTGTDRRFIQPSGPFTMHSNDTQIVTIGAFAYRGSSNYASVCGLLENSVAVQKFYNSNFAAIPLPPLPSVSVVADGDGKIVLYWGPRSESYAQYDSLGNTGTWRFEGYNIYQIKPGTGGDNESDRSLLAVYDLVNNITTVFDTVRVLQPDGTTQDIYKPVAFGNNNNVSHHIVLSHNKYPTGVNDFFINGQTYKFAVTAYGVNLNAGKPFKVLENPVSGASFNVIPNFNIMGTEIVHKKFDTLSYNKPDRVLFPIVLDPLKVQSATYKLNYRPDNTFNVFRVKNAQVDTLIRGAINLGISDTRAYVVDGILFKIDTISRIIYGVIKDPSATSQSKNYGWTYTGNRNLQGMDTTGLNINYPAGNFKAMQSISMGLSWVNGQVSFGGTTTNSTFRGGFSSAIDTNFIKVSALKKVKVTFGQTQKAYRYRGAVNNAPYQDFVDIPFKVEIDDPVDTAGPPRQVNVGFYDFDSSGTWNPKATSNGGLEYVMMFYSTYSETALPFYAKNIGFLTQFRQLDIQYVWWPRLINSGPAFTSGDVMTIVPYTKMQYQQSPGTVTTITLTPTTAATIGSLEVAKSRNELEMVRVVPNPYYGGHAQETSPFDRFVKFMNLPKSVTIYIYSLNGNLVRQLSKDGIETSLNWDLLNTDRIPVASGIYIAYIDAPGIGSKIIKIAVFTPEERLDTF